MKKRKSLFIFLLVLIYTANGYSQKVPMSIPSPEAASLGIVGNIPVSLHTGQVNVSVPLLEVKCGNYTLPVSLSYNASGVMPDIRPTWVGQNWNLNVGGVITRRVKDLPDDNPGRGLYFLLQNNNNAFNLYNNNWSSSAYLTSCILNPAVNQLDMEPDEFYFNINGISGKFYLGHDRKFHVVSNPGIKVETHGISSLESSSSNAGTIYAYAFYGFKITDQNGIIYHFGYGDDYFDATEIENSSDVDVSSWLLSMIEIPGRGFINFTYADFYQDRSVQLVVRDMASQWNLGSTPALFNSINNSGFCWSTGGISYDKNVYHRYLESIDGPNFHLDFRTSASNDLGSGPSYSPYSSSWQKLDSIILKDKSNTRVKSFHFTYNNTPRLYLQSVKEAGMPVGHQFTYQGRQAHLLYRMTRLDHWGYPNNYPDLGDDFASAMQQLYSPIAQKFYIQADTAEYFTLNRETNPSWVTAGILKQIIYPTGGTVNFEFEANEYSQYSYTHPTNSNGVAELVFKGVKRRWSDFRDFEGRNITLLNPAKIWLKFENSNDAATIYEFTVPSGVYSIDDFWGNTGKTVPLDDWEEYPAYQNYYMKMRYKELESAPNAYAGGARIKKISHTDGNKSTIREYKYVKNFSLNQTANVSSGQLGSIPIYSYFIDSSLWPSGNYGVSSSQSFTEASLTEGSPVGYSEVAEIIKDSQNNILGYTVYKYTNFDTNPDDMPVNAKAVVTRDLFARSKKDMERGKLLSQKVFSTNNTLIQQTNYTYHSFTRGNAMRGIRCEELMSSCYVGNWTAYTASAYYVYNNSYLPVTETETVYDVNGQNPVTTQRTYDYNFYDQIKKTEVTLSDGSIRREEVRYPSDFQTEPYPVMVTKNILNPIVETSVYKNTSFIEKTANDYALQYNGLYAPINLKYQKVNANMEIRETYQYDIKGNIREIVKNGTEKTAYFWSYNHQYPVVKVEGVSYNDIASIGAGVTNAFIIGLGITDAAFSALRNLLGSRFPQAQITTYEYQPLVGMTKLTDPRGVITTYEYDTFGRLQTIRDHNSNVLEKYEYHYKD